VFPRIYAGADLAILSCRRCSRIVFRADGWVASDFFFTDISWSFSLAGACSFVRAIWPRPLAGLPGTVVRLRSRSEFSQEERQGNGLYRCTSGSIQVSELQFRTRRYTLHRVDQIRKEFNTCPERALFVAFLRGRIPWLRYCFPRQRSVIYYELQLRQGRYRRPMRSRSELVESAQFSFVHGRFGWGPRRCLSFRV